jgi:hypothetical protein
VKEIQHLHKQADPNLLSDKKISISNLDGGYPIMKTAWDFWPRVIREEKDIPEPFNDFFQKINVGQTFPYTIFVPTDRLGRHKTNMKLVCLFDNRIYIAEKDKRQIHSQCFDFDKINYIESGMLLLQSWFKINGNLDWKPMSVTVEYNSSMGELFKPVIEKIRIAIHNLKKEEDFETELTKEIHKFDCLSAVSHKYMVFGKQSLLPGLKVFQILFQPDIWAKHWKYFKRIVTFNHLMILTDKELIIIKDDDQKGGMYSRNGGIWHYIPLTKINRVDVTAHKKEGLNELSINFSNVDTISALFVAGQKSQLDLLRSNIEKLQKTSFS